MTADAATRQAQAAVARASLALSDEALLAECAVDVYIGGGPGGQHRNKTESAVRLTHRPTAVTVKATERRSQLQNRDVALARLRAALTQLAHVEAPRRATRPTRASKRRRLDEKKKLSEKKQGRRAGW
jgi:ribosome-associated protein